MKTTAISAAALTLGLILAAQAAHAQDGARLNDPAQLQREHNRAVAAGDWANDPYDSRSSDDLNRRQLDQSMYGPVNTYSNNGPMADTTASTNTDYSSDQTYSSDDNTSITVVGPSHDAREASPDPDTNPQSTGTPVIDTPYAVPPGTPIRPDDDSSGMSQPQ